MHVKLPLTFGAVLEFTCMLRTCNCGHTFSNSMLLYCIVGSLVSLYIDLIVINIMQFLYDNKHNPVSLH